jgi:4-hydroxy 2-oxovalerate aldolase
MADTYGSVDLDYIEKLIPYVISLFRNTFNNNVIEVGFHAHNNLGVAISNAAEAIQSGASIIDGASMGLGAGAGNAQLENIVSTGIRNKSINSDITKFLEMSQKVENEFLDKLPSEPV